MTRASTENSPGRSGFSADDGAITQRPVAKVMTRDVLTLSPEMGLTQAITLLIDRGVAAMPVVERGGVLVGILSESDLLRVLGRGDTHGHPRLLELARSEDLRASFALRAEGARVDAVMTRRVATAAETTTLAEAALLMAGHGVKRLPVLREELLVGIVSRSDLVRALGARTEFAPRATSRPSDASLRRAVESEIDATRHGEWVVATVKDGVVRLEGMMRDNDRHYALVRRVAAIAGIAGVEDRMVASVEAIW